MTNPRPPITCHVLNTLSGTPAPSINVHLTLLSLNGEQSKETFVYRASTNSDGRVTSWMPRASSNSRDHSLEDLFRGIEGEMEWEIQFDVRSYWRERGVRAFFPEVRIAFVTEGFAGRDSVEGDERRRHWHVPLLLGPYSYTTYRGS
jgi:5-hydroxyisourate hydrolase